MSLYGRRALRGPAIALALIVSGCASGANSVSPLAQPAPLAAQSWMSPGAKTATLIYAVDSRTGEVNVYDYSNGQQVGTISGDFIIAAAGCVDARGDVFLTAGENVMEYAHGGTTPLQTYTPSHGQIVGCSIDAKGDLAVSTSSPGGVVIYAKGNPKHSVTYSNSECENQASMGYDNKGDVIGAGGGYDAIQICAVLARTRQETTLSTTGITINSADGTMWDGKYIAVSDGEAGSEKEVTGIYQATLSGKTITSHNETFLDDTCYRGLAFVLNPFIVGTKNTPLNDREASVVVGVNADCFMSGSGGLEYWHYPKGGNPYKTYATTDEVTVLAVRHRHLDPAGAGRRAMTLPSYHP